MEPQTHTPAHGRPQESRDGCPPGSDRSEVSDSSIGITSHLQAPFRLFVGDDGLRCGWSALLFVALYYLLLFVLDIVALTVDPHLADIYFSPVQMAIGELVPLFAILGAGLVMARAEQRRLIGYNLADTRGVRHFVSGILAGFVALSTLIAALALGGWLHFGPPALRGGAIFKYALLWACAFLLVGLFEEGFFRCYLLSTLTRGINFWWALATVASLCLLLVASRDPQGSGGVFLIAFLGIIPCWLLHRAHIASSSFWQATWATSTAFGFFHTNNGGENTIGIFAAALVGMAFCISVRLTGSAWWAIGCHAAWDWAETYFYGTPDSGLSPARHLLATTPVGDVLWSGGTDGPEGSLLVVPVILLLIAFLVAFYRVRSVAHAT